MIPSAVLCGVTLAIHSPHTSGTGIYWESQVITVVILVIILGNCMNLLSLLSFQLFEDGT